MKALDDTIAAVATAPGEGGIAIVRVSGPGAAGVAAALLRGRAGDIPALEPRRVTWAKVEAPEGGGAVDEVLAVWMPGPASYTRDDVLELQCHGGQAAAAEILALVLARGVRLADPGEFTLRAYLRGRIDLVQAEAVLDAIRAQTAEALRVHEGLLGGRLSEEVGRWQEALGRALVRIEGCLDFPEEDLGELDSDRMLAEVEAVREAMAEKLGTYAWGRVSREGFRVALLGRPNTGKSSLLNCLAQEDCAIVSPLPGTTRDAIEVRLNVCGAPVRLVDTAGLRRPGDAVEEEGVRRARKIGGEADLVLFLCDGSQDLSAEEADEARRLAARGRALAVVSKVDLGRRPEESLEWTFGRKPLGVSVVTGEGVEPLLRAIRDAAWGGGGPGVAGALTRERHRRTVEEAKGCLERAEAGLREGVFPELVASEVHGARRQLAALLGWGTDDDVLDAIFEEFCIGK